MSRSRRRSPIAAITSSESEKDDKRAWHSNLRSKEKQRLKSLTIATMDAFIPLLENNVSDPYWFDKDGKHWFGDYLKRDDKPQYKKRMRK